jgi:ribosome maturation factor RimP
VTIDGYVLANIFMYHLQVLTTNNSYIIVDFHTKHHFTLSLLSLRNSYSTAMSSLDVSSWGKERPVCKTDNFTTICEPTV